MAKIDQKKKLFQKYMNIFSDIDKNKLSFVEKELENLAFYEIEIDGLKKRIETEGNTIEGKKNAAVDVLTIYQKSCNTIVRQLIDLVPASQKESKLEMLKNG